jgi:hypothetical protein
MKRLRIPGSCVPGVRVPVGVVLAAPATPGSAVPGRNDGASALATPCGNTGKLLDWAGDPAVKAQGQ